MGRNRYKSEKRRKEIVKKQKQEAKRARKLARRTEGESDEPLDAEVDGSTDETEPSDTAPTGEDSPDTAPNADDSQDTPPP